MTDEDVKTDPASDTNKAMELTKEQLYEHIPPEWICLFYGKQSLLGRMQLSHGLVDNDGTRVHLRALVHELVKEGRIFSECRTWPEPENDTNFHHTQCRRV